MARRLGRGDRGGRNAGAPPRRGPIEGAAPGVGARRRRGRGACASARVRSVRHPESRESIATARSAAVRGGGAREAGGLVSADIVIDGASLLASVAGSVTLASLEER